MKICLPIHILAVVVLACTSASQPRARHASRTRAGPGPASSEASQAESPTAVIDREVQAIEAEAGRASVYAFSADQKYSLEGSSGEIFATPERTVRKIVLTLYGETFQAELRLYGSAASLVLVEQDWKDYAMDETGLAGATIDSVSVSRIYLGAEQVLATRDATGAALAPDQIQELLDVARPVWRGVIECFRKPETWPSDECQIEAPKR